MYGVARVRTMPSDQEESALDSSLWQRARIIIWPDSATGRMQAHVLVSYAPVPSALPDGELEYEG